MKKLTVDGVDFKRSDTVTSKTSKSLFIMDIEYRLSPNLSLRWRK